MASNNAEIYRTAVRSFGEDGCTTKEAATRVYELYPDWAAKKQKGAAHNNQIRNEIASKFVGIGEPGFRCDKTVTPRIIYYIGDPDDELEITPEAEEAIFIRSAIIAAAEESMSVEENNRIEMFKRLRDTLNGAAGLKIELDHADSLKNGREAAHHPDNIQMLTKADNARKGTMSCGLFSFKEQEEYLLNEVKTLKRCGVSVDEEMVVLVLKMIKIIW